MLKSAPRYVSGYFTVVLRFFNCHITKCIFPLHQQQETAAIKTLEQKLASEVTKFEASIAGMVPKAEVAAAQKIAEAARQAETAAEATLSTLKSDLAAAKDAAALHEKKASTATSDQLKLQKENYQLKSSFKLADNEVFQLKQRAEQAENALAQLEKHHSSAWLPHWLDKTFFAQGGVWLQGATNTTREALSKATTAASVAWGTHIAPKAAGAVVAWSALNITETVKAKSSEVFAAGSHLLAQRNITFEMPASVTSAVNTVKTHFSDVASSDVVVKTKHHAAAALATLQQQTSLVVNEIETVIVSALKGHPALASLTEKPVSTYMVYLLLCAPILAVGMPLLASSRSRGGPSAVPGAAAPSSSRPKRATRSTSTASATPANTATTATSSGRKSPSKRAPRKA